MENLVINRDFWRGKRVFLTGHTGFKGAWLSLWLQDLGAHVTGYSLAAPTQPSLFEVANVADGMRSIHGDIRDLAALRDAMSEQSPEIVIHMAAQALVQDSYINPVDTYSTNVMGTVHVLEAVRKTKGVRAVVNVTSDKCYENHEWAWGYRENDSLGGHDPYSNSKGCAELVSSSYRSAYFSAERHSEHGVSLATARAGNVVGGGDWATGRLIPDVLRSFGREDGVYIRHPEAIRPWQHVLGPLSGYLLLAEGLFNDGPAFAEAWNFGPQDAEARPVRWIVDHLIAKWGNGVTWRRDTQAHPHEAVHLKLDSAKARNRLKWAPQWNLDLALDKIVLWQRAWLEGRDMREVTLAQILEYEHTPQLVN